MSDVTSSAPSRIPQNVLLIIFIALALSFTALVLALSIYPENSEVAGWLLLFGFLGVASSTYVLFQTRRRILRLRIETPSTTTTIECKKCGIKNVREFQRGDYIFKEVGPCQKCNEKTLITAIYKEVKEKGKEGMPS
jgi:hypothetical protein